MKDEALKLIEKKFKIVPCIGKHPKLVHWEKQPIDNEKICCEWWDKQDYNIAIATGYGYIVIDLDVKKDVNGINNFYNFLSEQKIELPQTLSVTTGTGGKHLYFATSKKIGGRVNFLKLGGIDIRGDRNCAIAPPSIHPDTGKPYEWDNDLPMAQLPQQLEDILVDYDDYLREYLGETKNNGKKTISKKQAPKKSNCSFKEEYKSLATITEGSRNDTLFRLASLLADIGISIDSIETVLYSENQNRCTPPLDEEELQLIISSISKYSPNDYTTSGFDKLYTGELSCNEIAIYTFLWWETLTLKDKTLYRNQQYIADRIGGVGTQIVGKATKSLHDKGFIDMKLVPNKNGGHPCYCYKVL